MIYGLCAVEMGQVAILLKQAVHLKMPSQQGINRKVLAVAL